MKRVTYFYDRFLIVLFLFNFFYYNQAQKTMNILIKDVDWCASPYCKIEKDHTICIHGPKCPPAKGCETHLDFNKEMKDYVMELHNEKRNKIASGEELVVPKHIQNVANMKVLQWDIHLELVARCHSRQCDPKHDLCRAVPRFSTVGQNIYTKKLSAEKAKNWDIQDVIEDAIEAWYSQNKNIPENVYEQWTETEEPSAKYTQMIWAATGFIGCGISQQKTEESIEFFLVCNYGPAGNIKEKRIYTPGQPCSKCPKGKKCNAQFKGLCGNIDEYAVKCPCEQEIEENAT